MLVICSAHHNSFPFTYSSPLLLLAYFVSLAKTVCTCNQILKLEPLLGHEKIIDTSLKE